MDQEMDESQINSNALNSAFSKFETQKGGDINTLFENMQINVMGGDNEENKSNAFSESSDEEEQTEVESYFKEDKNKISQKHVRHTDM